MRQESFIYSSEEKLCYYDKHQTRQHDSSSKESDWAEKFNLGFLQPWSLRSPPAGKTARLLEQLGGVRIARAQARAHLHQSSGDLSPLGITPELPATFPKIDGFPVSWRRWFAALCCSCPLCAASASCFPGQASAVPRRSTEKRTYSLVPQQRASALP